jgi:hypothetical protein
LLPSCALPWTLPLPLSLSLSSSAGGAPKRLSIARASMVAGLSARARAPARAPALVVVGAPTLGVVRESVREPMLEPGAAAEEKGASADVDADVN